jgi:hypothetical protein
MTKDKEKQFLFGVMKITDFCDKKRLSTLNMEAIC